VKESIPEANAMTVATCSEDGRPSARVVLLKGFDERGLVFHTNYQSRKGRELDATSTAAAVFFWEQLQRQVRVEGSVSRVPGEESDAYFASRPRGSRIGAWVSHQSQVLKGGRAELEERERALAEQYKDESQDVPRPPHWGGYVLRPTRVEFWQGRPSRLHDRIQYSQGSSGEWVMERLSP